MNPRRIDRLVSTTGVLVSLVLAVTNLTTWRDPEITAMAGLLLLVSTGALIHFNKEENR